jgi:hypothetical protein
MVLTLLLSVVGHRPEQTALTSSSGLDSIRHRVTLRSVVMVDPSCQ